MRIGIDISSIIYGTGVSVYTKKLVENLLKIDDQYEYLLFGGSLRRSGEIRDYVESLKAKNVTGKVLPISPTIADFLWNRLHSVSIETLIGSVNVFHTSDWAEPPSKLPKVTTIHDLSPLLFPRFTPSKIVEVHKRRLDWVKKESGRVIVPSHTTALDAIEFGIRKDAIRVIPESHIYDRASEEEIIEIKLKHHITGKYFLAVGANKRKNTYRIVKAFMKVNKALNYKLVVVGHPKFKVSSHDNVIFTNYISDQDMAALYSGTEALIYPSIYEGFGIPILEAFNLGVPVVTSNLGSMSEIANNNAVLVSPDSVKSIISGMKSVVEYKNKYSTLGKNEVKKYSWNKTAQLTLNVYKELLI
jgi:glycosyltransferase involved in cell wall biosynthesis